MAFEETKEQQQMYNYFRSCIYIFLIIEIVMNLPITSDNRVTQFILDLLGRFKMFNSVAGCKVAELVCICLGNTVESLVYEHCADHRAEGIQDTACREAEERHTPCAVMEDEAQSYESETCKHRIK